MAIEVSGFTADGQDVFLFGLCLEEDGPLILRVYCCDREYIFWRWRLVYGVGRLRAEGLRCMVQVLVGVKGLVVNFGNNVVNFRWNMVWVIYLDTFYFLMRRRIGRFVQVRTCFHCIYDR